MGRMLLGFLPEEELFRSQRTLVHRAVHSETGKRAVLKTLRPLRPTRKAEADLQREYSLLKSLRGIDGVIRAEELGRDGDQWVLVLEDIGGQALNTVIVDRPLRVSDFLDVAVGLAQTVSQVHAADVIHRDINPANIVVNRQTGQLRLIDFGIATRLPREASRFQGPAQMLGTLTHISPEQTGRMNRSVDHRSDLYSLGVTLYQLLAGGLPFEESDPLSLVHAHIARNALPLSERVGQVPAVLSDIVAKLMCKAPEDRYQSAASLAADLLDCQRMDRETGEIEPFPLDRRHTPSRLVLPEKLYGRDSHTDQIVSAFSRVASGATELVLVAGASGVGKSALIRELYRPITQRGGFFISGKFDQLQREAPYAVVIQALGDLSRQILSEPQGHLDNWKTELVEALGPNGQVLLDVIPEFEHVIGPQPPAPQLSSAEQRNRLQLIFARLFKVFASAAHPLGVFLDDLQWVDPASLQLIEALLSGGEVSHLLVIGAYRDNEVGPGHPLLLAADRIEHQALVRIDRMSLMPLRESHIGAFLADMTARSRDDVEELARIVVEKTDGNPFFAREFAQMLYTRGLIVFQRGRWTWDHRTIRSQEVTANVVDLVAGRLRALEPATLRVLKVAAALGAQFDLETLAVASAQPSSEVWQALWPALQAGFLLTAGDAESLLDAEAGPEDHGMVVRLRFAHDRIQQATATLGDADNQAGVHWEIGRRLIERWPLRDSEARLFDIVAHLNTGRAGCGSQDARDELAELNLRAARRARASAAFDAAYTHARVALELLGPGAEARAYDLVMELLTECVESAYQTGDIDGMDRWFEQATSVARTILDTAWIQEIKTEAFNAQGRPLDALSHALDFLEKLGVQCPREPGYDDVVAEMGAAAEVLATRTVDDLEHAADIEDPAIRVAVRLICKIYSSAYVASPFVFAVITLRQFQLVVRHGNSAISSLSFAVYGLLLAGLANDVEAAYTFGSLSSRMLDRADSKRFEAQAIHLFNCHTRMWSEHLRACADGERMAFRVGLETGEHEYGCYGAHVASKYALFHGQPLDSLKPEVEQYTAAMHRYRQDIGGNSHLPWHQTIINLTEPVHSPHRLAGPLLDARSVRPALEKINDRMAISNALTAELLLSTIFERFDEAVALGSEGSTFLDAVLSQFNQPLHLFLDALARLEHWHGAALSERDALRAGAESSLASLRGWAKAAPVNFEQKAALLEALLMEMDGRVSEARDRFDDAIALASKHEFLLDEALANEAAMRFHRRSGRASSVAHYLADTRDAYARWGAGTKVHALESAHPQLVPTSARSIGMLASVTPNTMESDLSALDISTLVRAAEAISSEVVLGKLLRRMLGVLMENAGAARVVLVLIEEGIARVEAEGTAEGRIDVLQHERVDAEGVGTALLPRSIYHYSLRSGEPLVIDDAASNKRFSSDPYVRQRRTRSVMCVPIKSQGRLTGVVYLENDQVPGVFTAQRSSLVMLLAGQMAVSIDNARLYENLERRVATRTAQLEARNSFIREVFGRYMSDEVVDTLLDSREALRLGGERRVVTLMFADLRGFTAMCERLSPEMALRAINNYFAVMTGIVQRYRGSINNIVGDGLLVLFGAPLQRPDHAEQAVACALQMQLAMAEVNRNNAADGLPELSMGIGVHTGEVVVGNIGSETRAKYSVIGRHVNLASRLEASTSGGEICVSEATCVASGRKVRIAEERRIHPKGLDEALSVFLAVGLEGRDDLQLPEAGRLRQSLAEPRQLEVRSVEGKVVSSDSQVGTLLAVGPTTVELRLQAPVAIGTDLAIESPGGLIYVRVLSGDETVLATVTGGDLARLV